MRSAMARALKTVAAGILVLLPAALAAAPPAPAPARTSLPVRFEPNVGQFAPDVRFGARLGAHRLLAKDGEVTLEVRQGRPRLAPGVRLTLRQRMLQRLISPPSRTRKIGMRMAAPSRPAAIEHLEKAPGVVHYMLGSDASRWRTNVPTYLGIRYRDAYPGADLVFYGNPRTLEYDLVVKPGARVEDLAIEFSGVESMEVEADGTLRLAAGGLTIRHSPPHVYQEVGGRREVVSGRYVVRADGKLGFAVGTYLAHLPLVIDPVPVLPGGGEAAVDFLAVDSAGNTYFTGSVYPDETTLPVAGGWDVFVSKQSPTGTPMWTTLLGGDGGDVPNGIALDAAGGAVVVGATSSSSLPALTALEDADGDILGGDEYLGGMKGWIARLTPDGAVEFTSYLGGDGRYDMATGVAIDAAGRVYVSGGTDSETRFPTTPTAAQPAFGGVNDAFLMVLDASGDTPTSMAVPPRVLYATFHGGAREDAANGVAVDSLGIISIAGETYADPEPTNDFPVKLAVQPDYGGGPGDAFVASFSAAAAGEDSLLVSTFLGGAGDEYAVGVGVDGSGAVYVAGTTDLPGFEGGLLAQTTGEPALPARSYDSFVAKFGASVSEPDLAYLAYVGGTDDDTATGIAVTSSGEVYLSGVTSSTDFPEALAVGEPVSAAGGDVAFVVKLGLTPLGPEPVLLYGTSLGTAGAEKEFVGMALASNGDLLIPGTSDEGPGNIIPNPAIVVAIDIRQEAINPGKTGVVSVAILPSATFDPESQLDRGSLTFGRTGDEVSLRRCEGRRPATRPTGKPLVCQFDVPAAGFASEDTHGLLKGRTLAGALVFGADEVRMVPKGHGAKHGHWPKKWTHAKTGHWGWGDRSREERLARAPGRR
ncbi:MAG: hypothetical protein ACE147_08070 [Candidatus Methylomirabilales bacterium]